MSGSVAGLRVLHLFSNCKWTGPAEPALNLCVSLRARGVEADFACAPDAGKSVNKIVETARARGIEPILDFNLRKHRHPLHDASDRRAISKLLASGGYGLVHCHLDNDHALALPGAARHGVPLLRSSYAGEGFTANKRNRRLLAGTAFVIEPSKLALQRDVETFGLSTQNMAVVPGAVDTLRFDPARALPSGRARLGLGPDDVIVGIVARMQTHRHYEDLFAAFRELAMSMPNVHLVVIGRGTKQETVAHAPVRALGLEARVHFTGYLDGDDYVAMLAALDAGVFLVPGTDGTCRAARELLAMGKPMVVTTRGMLPEIVRDGVDGFVCDGTPSALREALSRLCGDETLRGDMAAAARKQAVAVYSLGAQAEAVMAIYARLIRE